jgi:hypothetical protein
MIYDCSGSTGDNYRIKSVIEEKELENDDEFVLNQPPPTLKARKTLTTIEEIKDTFQSSNTATKSLKEL